MYIKQISIYVENTQGRLAEITEIIAAQGIDIRALSLADTTNFGILRLIVNKPYDAQKALTDAGYTVALTPVIAIGVPDTPGSLSKAIKLLSDNNINIEYMYAFVAKKQSQAMSIIRVDDGDRALEVLKKSNISFFVDKDIDDI